MSVLKIWRKLRGVLKQSEGFYLMASLTSVPTILVMLNPSNGYGWGLFVLLLVRVLLFRNRALLLHTLLVLLLSVSGTWVHIHTNVSQLEGAERQGIIRMDPNHLKMEGDLLQGSARFLSGKGGG